MKKVCPKCLKRVDVLTRDHIIPKYIYKIAKELVPHFRKNLGQKNINYICADCNSRKGAKIDVSEQVGLDFWLDVRAQIDKAINKHFS